MVGWSRQRLLIFFRNWLTLGMLLALGAVLVTVLGDKSHVRIATNFFLLCGLVIALQSFTGNSGIISFGHVAFYGIGAYAAAIITIPTGVRNSALPDLPTAIAEFETNIWLATVIAAVLSGVFALIIGLAFSRMQERAMAMATLALLVTMHTVFSNWESVTRGTIGLYGVPRSINLWGSLGGAIIIAGAALLFKASPTGLNLQASREDPLAAQALGVDLVRVRLAGWVVSAILMGAGGALWSANSLAFSPDQFYFAQTFTLLSMLVIGGLGSVTGALSGVLVITLISELLRDVEEGVTIGSVTIPQLPGLVQLTVALLILLILIFRSHGLVGHREAGEFLRRGHRDNTGS